MDFKYKCFGLNNSLFHLDRCSSDTDSLLKVYICLSTYVYTCLNISINLLLEYISILKKTLKAIFQKTAIQWRNSIPHAFSPSGTDAKSQRHEWAAQGINKKLEELSYNVDLNLAMSYVTLNHKISAVNVSFKLRKHLRFRTHWSRTFSLKK